MKSNEDILQQKYTFFSNIQKVHHVTLTTKMDEYNVVERHLNKMKTELRKAGYQKDKLKTLLHARGIAVSMDTVDPTSPVCLLIIVLFFNT